MILYLNVEIKLVYVSSLKEKRNILKGLLQKIRKRFNVSCIESGNLDDLKFTILQFVAVGNSKKYLEKSMDEIVSMIELNPQLIIVRYDRNEL